MKAKKKSLRGDILTIALFVLAMALLLFSAAGSSRAALTYFSETYRAEVSMYEIGVTLLENGHDVSNRDYTGADDEWDENTGTLVSHMLEDTDDKLLLDHAYDERLSVRNSGRIDEYVRVSVYHYWVDKDGNKRPDMDPKLIDLQIESDNGNGWTLDEDATTDERTVLYYQSILPSGATTREFSSTLTIHQSVDGTGGMRAKVKQLPPYQNEQGQTVFETVYEFDGAEFVLRCDVDAVQTHNAADAIRSAWGIEMGSFNIR